MRRREIEPIQNSTLLEFEPTPSSVDPLVAGTAIYFGGAALFFGLLALI